MISQEENDRLCRIGPGTPMGMLFRRFWLPICTADRLPHPSCAPLAERLLGEDFVVFRNGNGDVGVLDEICMHRGASLALGRVEDCGIRCIYHGWKFGNDGTVLDIMNLPPEKRPHFKAPAFPAVEEGGMVWVYLGPPKQRPPFPRHAFMNLPESNRVLLRVDGNYNWVQATESGLDSSHVGILHSNVARPGWNAQLSDGLAAMDDTAPALQIEDTEFGYHYAAFRKDPAGGPDNVRIVPFIMPSGRIIPGGRLQGENNQTLVLEIPIDDENTATYSVRYGTQPIPRETRLHETGFDDPDMYSAETQRFIWTRAQLHRQRRDMMDRNWSGFRGIALEDAVIATSMRPIQDRRKEHLIASDLAVVRLRRRLLESVARMERGADPIGVHVDAGAIRSIDAPMPGSGHWRSLIPSHKVVEAAVEG
jgi:phthalate 4,5-dioxygenase